MRIIYEPRGRALEYAKLAASLYRWCPFRCLYCFVPAMSNAKEHGVPYPRKYVLSLLEKDLQELQAAGDEREILMSFTTDPYQPLEIQHKLTRAAIKLMIKYERHFTILTKAGNASIIDIDLLMQRPDLCRYGTTLVFFDESDRQIWEPGAASTKDRIGALWLMKENGIRNWVSLEPVVYPEQTLELIRQTVGFVDEFRIGKFNHIDNPGPELRHVMDSIGYCYPTDEDWRAFVQAARNLLEGHGCRYVFKKDLQPYLPGGKP